MSHLARSPSPSQTTSLEYLPPELLQQIFTYACTDGGNTGRSLSLVSRYISAVVRPFRFQSVALTSLRQIKLFLACLKRERAHTRIEVRRLFISTWRDGQEVARIRNGRMPHWDVLKDYGINILLDGPQWCTWMSLQEVLDRELSQLLPLVLEAVANNLTTLYMVHSWEFDAIRLPAKFPVLQECTFCGPSPTFPGGCVRLCPPPPPCFPSLRYLHVVSWNASAEFWLHHSPLVTHLRLSDINCASRALADELRRSLGFVFGEYCCSFHITVPSDCCLRMPFSPSTGSQAIQSHLLAASRVV